MASDERETNDTIAATSPKRGSGGDGSSAQPGGAAVGDALRTVYEQAVKESVPSEMLDLLSRLD